MKRINKLDFFVEILIFGVIVSLIIHHYFLQSFKVMTHSMEPTLIGDPQCGDRIIVKKSAYYLQNPARWDPVVFRYPHNMSQIFIKRLIGLPGEKIHIQNGEIYVNNKIARKPEHITKTLLSPLFPQTSIKDTKTIWEISEGWKWLENKFVAQNEKMSWLRYKPVIVNKYTPQNNTLFLYRKNYAYPVGGNEYVGEIVFEASLKPLEQKGSFQIEIREGNHRFICNLSITDNKSYIAQYAREQETPLKKVDIAYQLPSQTETAISLANIDDLLSITIQGQNIAFINYSEDASTAPTYTFESSFSMGIENSHIEISNIRLWRDIYYISRRDFFGGLKHYQIPSNNYFVLGDNPPNSRDSKDWQRFYFFFKNGVHIAGDQKKFPHGSIRKFVDVYGHERNIPNTMLKKDYLSRQDSPYVPASYVIGQAFFVFWPPNRLKTVY